MTAPAAAAAALLLPATVESIKALATQRVVGWERVETRLKRNRTVVSKTGVEVQAWELGVAALLGSAGFFALVGRIRVPSPSFTVQLLPWEPGFPGSVTVDWIDVYKGPLADLWDAWLAGYRPPKEEERILTEGQDSFGDVHLHAWLVDPATGQRVTEVVGIPFSVRNKDGAIIGTGASSTSLGIAFRPAVANVRVDTPSWYPGSQLVEVRSGDTIHVTVQKDAPANGNGDGGVARPLGFLI